MSLYWNTNVVKFDGLETDILTIKCETKYNTKQKYVHILRMHMMEQKHPPSGCFCSADGDWRRAPQIQSEDDGYESK